MKLEKRNALKDLYKNLDVLMAQFTKANNAEEQKTVAESIALTLESIQTIDKDEREKYLSIATISTDVAIKGLAIIAPALLYAMLYKQGLQFEQEGVYRSFNVQNLIRNVKPGK